MPLIISDEKLREAGLTAQDAAVEVGCRLFDAGRLSLWSAAQLAGLTRVQFEGELMSRGIAVYRPTIEDFRSDIDALKKLGV